jgi:hypothetical protein
MRRRGGMYSVMSITSSCKTIATPTILFLMQVSPLLRKVHQQKEPDAEGEERVVARHADDERHCFAHDDRDEERGLCPEQGLASLVIVVACTEQSVRQARRHTHTQREREERGKNETTQITAIPKMSVSSSCQAKPVPASLVMSYPC